MAKVQQASDRAPLPRRLRLAGAVAAAVLVASGAALVATQIGDDSAPAPGPVAATHAPTPTRPALPGGARQGAVAVSVASPDHVFRLTMNVGCVACSTVWERDGSGAWQRLHDFGAEAYAGDVDQHYGPVEQLAMAANGRDGWAWGQRLYSTHDGGHTWARVTIQPDPGVVLQPTVVTTRSYAWSLFFEKRTPHLYRSPVGTDDWKAVPLPQAGRVDAVETVGDRVVLEATGTGADSLLVSSTDDGTTWSTLAKPCVGENAGSAAFLMCPPPPAKPSAGVTIYGTTDFTSWSVLGHATGGIAGFESIGIGRLLLVQRDHADLLATDGRTPVDLPLAARDQIGPSSSSGDTSYVTVDGNGDGTREYLIASSDAGRTWAVAP